jgi:2-keto-4-pentenoate hydratase/2-oxohepta-3-ene-1,7-dioic acid hydratase in catechol pathway
MIWPVPELVARISEHVTVEPGDVVLTGTPAGVGLSTGVWMKVGDRLDGEITGLGALRVEIVEDRPEADEPLRRLPNEWWSGAAPRTTVM